MTAAGIRDPRSALAHLFGRDVMDSSMESRNQRIQFIRQVAVPVALGMLATYEQADLTAGTGALNCTLRDFFHMPATDDGENRTAPPLPFTKAPAPNNAALAYVESYVQKHADENFSLLDIPLQINPRRLDDTVRSTLKDVLSNLCEVIHLYDCDALLLTGRPSRWQGIVDTVFANLPVPPDRIVRMGIYRVGGWYPFSDARGRLTDPITTGVVGAILCTLAEGQLEGFSFDPANLALRSTARFIGEMELNGQIKDPKIWFTVDVEDRKEREYTKTISFAGPIAVGFRQLDAERWTTTRFYFLEFVNEEARRKYAPFLPFTLSLRLVVSEISDDTPPDTDNVERDEGEFFIDEALDREGNSIPVQDILDFRLQTLPRNEGFWLDTGVVFA